MAATSTVLGPRDAREFVYLGDASLIHRPNFLTASPQAMHDYTHQRANPAGLHRELWYLEQGDSLWPMITRSTVNHEITRVELARDVARHVGRSR